MKVLLKGGKIYDGTGDEPTMGDVLIEDDKIREVGGNIDAVGVDQVVELGGKSIAPGFIDAHSHNDWFAIKNDPMPYFLPFIRQGITTFIGGNCGVSEVGFQKDCKYVDKMGGGLFFFKDTKGVYGNVSDFFEEIDGNCPANMAELVGHCSARAAVSGFSNRKLTKDEETQMLAIIEDNLKNGAAGVSLGLMYEPGLYADKEELRKVVELCVKYDKPLTVHPRANSAVSMAYPELLGRSHILRAVDELVEISKGTNLKLQYSHAIFVGRKSLKDQPEFLSLINQMRKEGVRAQFDIYNELKGVSVITVILPTWYQGMSEEERNKPLTKLKLRLLIKATSILLGFGYDDIEVAYIGPGFEKYEGKTVHQLAKENHKSDLDMYLQLCKESNFQGRVNMGPYTTEDIIHDFEKNELCLYMTDAWVEEHGIQNPAIYDCFPKFLQDALRGKGDTLPKTIQRMTGATADRFMIKYRGYLKPGYYADITVFDEEALKNSERDRTCSFGIDRVYINGKEVLVDGEIDEKLLLTAGKAIRV